MQPYAFLCVLHSNNTLTVPNILWSTNTKLNCFWCVIENKCKHLLWLKFLVLHGLLSLAELFWLDQHLDSSLRHLDPSLIKKIHTYKYKRDEYFFLIVERQCIGNRVLDYLHAGRTNLQCPFTERLKSEKVSHYAFLARTIISVISVLCITQHWVYLQKKEICQIKTINGLHKGMLITAEKLYDKQ